MTTYLINHLRQPGIVNSEVLEYLDQVQATLDPFGGKFIVQGGEVEVLEGAWAESVIVLSFPDITKARTWYRSSAYQKILRLRTDHVVGDVILIDGVSVPTIRRVSTHSRYETRPRRVPRKLIESPNGGRAVASVD